VPDLDNASRKELVNFTKMLIEALPSTDQPSRKLPIIESMIKYTTPKNEGGTTQDNPVIYIRRISAYIIYYGPLHASKLMGVFKNVREKASFMNVITKKRAVYPKSPEKLLILSDALPKVGVAQDTKLYTILMERAAGFSIRMETAIARITRAFEAFGESDAAISALEKRPSALFNTDKVLEEWLSNSCLPKK
jgi:hypothetical protein